MSRTEQLVARAQGLKVRKISFSIREFHLPTEDRVISEQGGEEDMKAVGKQDPTVKQQL